VTRVLGDLVSLFSICVAIVFAAFVCADPTLAGRTRVVTLLAPASTPASGVEWRVDVPSAELLLTKPAVPGACVTVDALLAPLTRLCETGTSRCGPAPVPGSGTCSSTEEL
jgi:hypothetical protein